MVMGECLFCNIVRGKIPFHKVYEDDEFLAFLDIFPNSKGMTLVMPKKHLGSDIFSLSDNNYVALLEASRIVAKKLEKALSVKRVAFISEGMGIDHVHVKLYPLHGLKGKFEETWAEKRVFFDKYEGYVTTLMGPRADDDKLAKLAKKILKA